jgi:hypothetical protein
MQFLDSLREYTPEISTREIDSKGWQYLESIGFSIPPKEQLRKIDKGANVNKELVAALELFLKLNRHLFGKIYSSGKIEELSIF